jgi:glutamate dehydrogenase/leucine dehydrogenase
VYYGATFVEAQLCSGEEVVVVGGGNAAAQAAVFLAESTKHVYGCSDRRVWPTLCLATLSAASKRRLQSPCSRTQKSSPSKAGIISSVLHGETIKRGRVGRRSCTASLSQNRA